MLRRSGLWVRSVSFVVVVSLATVAFAGLSAGSASAATAVQSPSAATLCASVQPTPGVVSTTSGFSGFVAAVCSDLEHRLGVTTLPPVLPPGTPPGDLIEYALLGLFSLLVQAANL